LVHGHTQVGIRKFRLSKTRLLVHSQKDLRSQTVGPMVYLKPIMPVRSGYIPVKNALRPDVQLCIAVAIPMRVCRGACVFRPPTAVTNSLAVADPNRQALQRMRLRYRCACTRLAAADLKRRYRAERSPSELAQGRLS